MALLQRLTLLACVTTIYAQSLISTLESHSDLSKLNAYIQSFPSLQATLTNLNNYTLFAPSDAAITTWLNKTSPTQDYIEATLNYHILHGGWPLASFSTTPLFPDSYLSNSSFVNVTGGAAVELLAVNGTAVIQSAVKAPSYITQGDLIADNGLFRIIDPILSIPLNESPTATEANMTYLIAILTKGGFLGGEGNAIGNELVIEPDITFFVPNSAAASSEFSNITSGWSQDMLDAILKYHAVSGVVLYSTSMKNGTVLPTFQDNNLTIYVGADGAKYVNDVKILVTDYLISNGVMHTIDGILNPFNITKAQTTAPAPSNSLGTGVIVGIAIGSAAFVTLLLLGIFFRRRSKRRTAARTDQIDSANQYDSFERPSYPDAELESPGPPTMGESCGGGSLGWRQEFPGGYRDTAHTGPSKFPTSAVELG